MGQQDMRSHLRLRFKPKNKRGNNSSGGQASPSEREELMKLLAENDNPMFSDEEMLAMFDDIYKQLPKGMTENTKEKLAVWIADRVANAHVEGYKQGCIDTQFIYDPKDDNHEKED